jgi:hypothetical protein
MFRVFAWFAFAIGATTATQLAALADFSCNRCGAVMHTDQPQSHCWSCGRPMWTPQPSSPQPQGGDGGQFSSGFELGVRFVPTPQGIRIIGVKPDSAAAGVLFVDDIVSAAAYRDEFGQTHKSRTRNSDELENVKQMAGAAKTALMIRRPTGQVRFAFVVFRPAGQVAAGAITEDDSGPRQRGGVRMAIDDSGEAASLFSGLEGRGGVSEGGDGDVRSDATRRDGGDAADFFKQ